MPPAIFVTIFLNPQFHLKEIDIYIFNYFKNKIFTLLKIIWQWEDKAAYKETLLKLAGLFKKNFEVFANYKIGNDGSLTDEILAAGPNF